MLISGCRRDVACYVSADAEITGGAGRDVASCRVSRRCSASDREAADGRSVIETSMRALIVVLLEPARQAKFTLARRRVVEAVSPFAQSGLNETFGLAVGARGIGTGEEMAELERNGPPCPRGPLAGSDAPTWRRSSGRR